MAMPTHSSAKSGILVFGDSLSASYGIKPEQGWVALLEQRLEAEGVAVKLTNASISGETSGGGLRRLPALLEKYQPRLVILELGANDGLRGFPLRQMRNNLQQMIDLSKQAGADVLLLGMQIPPNYGQRYTRQFFESYRQLAEDNQLKRVPFFLEGVALRPDLMQADGLHPRAEAQPIMLKNVWPYLEKLL